MKRVLLTAVLYVSFGLVLSVDGRSEALWTLKEWTKVRSFSPLFPPPPDPTNRFAASDRAARLGRRLFFDGRLSPQGVSCAACHKPEAGFADGLKVTNTIAPLHRNTMTILNVGQYRWLTWDGSRDSLWHQAVAPIENPKEMGSSRFHVVKTVMPQYGQELARLVQLPKGFETLWPALPEQGKPGETAYDSLPAEKKHKVNRVFASILKLIGAYESRIVSREAPFDRFVAGDSEALSVWAQKGFQHFLRFGCDVCHDTPLFSDDEFHNLGTAPVPVADRGRYDGLAILKASPFRGTRPFADGEPVVRAEDYPIGESLVGAFRTPSLRELKHTGPYGHNGSIPTLEEWMDHYVRVTSSIQGNFVGKLDPALAQIRMTETEKKELVEFLVSLSSDYASEWTLAPPGSARSPLAR